MTLRVPSTTSNPADWQRKTANAINQMMNRAEAVATVTGATTLDTSHSVVLADASGGAFTIALPKAGAFAGRLFQIKKVDSSANAVTIDGDGSETIDGAATYALATQYQAVALLSDGTNWLLLPSFAGVYQPLDTQLTSLAGLAYTGNASKLVRVKSDESGFELFTQANAAWTQIATATPTGTATVTFSSIPTTYSDLLMTYAGVSHNSGTATGFTIALSANGSTFGTAVQFTSGDAATNSWYGSVLFPGYRMDAGIFTGGAMVGLTSPNIATATASAFVWRCTGGIAALRTATGLGNFDAGTITLYGR